MTQEDKELLLKDLCARAPYETKCAVFHNDTIRKDDETVFYVAGANILTFESYERDECYMYWQIKPYLRPMSSMTEDEKKEYTSYCFEQPFLQKDKTPNLGSVPMCIDWLNAHHFDYRGLIEKGLALEAPEGMYKL